MIVSTKSHSLDAVLSLGNVFCAFAFAFVVVVVLVVLPVLVVVALVWFCRWW